MPLCRRGSFSQSLLFTVPVAVVALVVQEGCSTPKPHDELEAPGAIVVTVTGEPWGLVSGANVQVEDMAQTIKLSGRTNSCGVVVFEPLPDGIYSVHGEFDGT